jgi:autotransporter-associated beta strand protein
MTAKNSVASRLGGLALLVCLFILPQAQAINTYWWIGDDWTTGRPYGAYWSYGNSWSGSEQGGSIGSQTTVQGYVNFGKWINSTPYNGLYNTTNDLGNPAMYQVYFKSDAPAAYNLYGNALTFYDFSSTDPNIQNEGTTYTPTINMAITNANVNGTYNILNINLNSSPAQGPITFNGPIYNNADAVTRVINIGGGNITFNGIIGNGLGSGIMGLTLVGAGTVTLAASNTFTGDLAIDAGTVTLATNNALAASTNFIRLGNTTGSTGANLNLNGGNFVATKMNVRAGSSGTKIIANSASTTGTATFGGNTYLDDNVTLYANSGGGITLSGSVLDLKNQTLTINGPGTCVISGGLTNSTGTGKLVINATGTTTLSGTNNFSGVTTLSSGTLLLNGIGAGSALTNSAGILGGTGTLSTVTAIQSGGTLQPGLGSDTATFTISNTLSLAGKITFNLNRTNAQNANKISGLTSVAYGGTLTVTNLGPALQSGDTFILFSSAAYTGGFTNIVLPTLTGALVWNTNNLAVNGSISVALSPVALALVSSKNPAGFQDSLTFTASVTPTAATGSIIFFNGSTPFSTNTLVTGSATSAAINTLPRGTNSITAIYRGDSNYYGATNSLSQIFTNHPPVANNTSGFRGASTSWKMKLTDLVTNATDVDGDSLSVTAVGTSTNGVVPTISSGYVFYINTNLVNDQFTYTVSDGNGGSAMATIRLTAQAFATGQNGTVFVSGSSATVSFAGIPGLSYTIQRSTNFVSWTSILTTNAPTGGVFSFVDTFSDLGGAPGSAYYRLQYNP